MKIYVKKFWIHFILAAVISVAVLYGQALREVPNTRAGDAYAYLSVAKNLADTGIFTDGRFQGAGALHGAQNQGMFFAPLYPALLAVVIKIDPVFAGTVSCHMGMETKICADNFGLLRHIQIGLGALATFLIWIAGYVLTRGLLTAWIALALSLLTGVYSEYTAQIMTEALLLPLFTAAMTCAAAAWQKQNRFLFLLSGLCLGLCALTRPSFAYLLYAGLPALLILSLAQKNQPLKTKILWPLFLLLGYGLVTLPWIVRNGQSVGAYAISRGYDSYILVQRISYNEMSWREWCVSFLYGLPDFGDSLAAQFFPPEDFKRFEYENPDGFYMRGNGIIREQTLMEAGSVENHLPYLLREKVIGNFFKHIMVTFSLAWRGMWVAKYWGLITIPLFLCVCFMALRKRWVEFLIFAMPPWFMLGFHAFTSVNIVRYNLILIPVLSIAAAFLSTSLICFIQGRYKNNDAKT